MPIKNILISLILQSNENYPFLTWNFNIKRWKPNPRLLIIYLINNGCAPLDEVDEVNRTALLYASKCNDVILVNTLLKNGANPNILDATVHKDSALSWAVYNNHIDCVDLLVKYGADINHQTEWDGRSLLMWSYFNQTYDLFVKLLNYGCDTTLLNLNNRSIMYICKFNNNTRFIDAINTYKRLIGNILILQLSLIDMCDTNISYIILDYLF